MLYMSRPDTASSDGPLSYLEGGWVAAAVRPHPTCHDNAHTRIVPAGNILTLCDIGLQCCCDQLD